MQFLDDCLVTDDGTVYGYGEVEKVSAAEGIVFRTKRAPLPIPREQVGTLIDCINKCTQQ